MHPTETNSTAAAGTQANGIGRKCGRCKSDRSRVYSSKPGEAGDIVRYRTCEVCGMHWKTVER